MTDAIPLFQGEAMLLSWSDTSTRGKTVTFALHHDECGDVHPFRGLGTGKSGQRFALVAVPITDDGEPNPPEVKATHGVVARSPSPQETASGAASKGGWYGLKPSARAALLCKEESFRIWINRTFTLGVPVENEEEVTAWLRTEIGARRRDLDAPAHSDLEHPAKVSNALLRFAIIERAYRVSRGLDTAEIG